MIAVSGNDARALRLTLWAIAISCALAVGAWALLRDPVLKVVVLLTLLTLAGGIVPLTYLAQRRSVIVVSKGELIIQGLLSSDELSIAEIKSASGAYKQPGLGERVAMALAAKTRAQPQALLTLQLEHGPKEISVGFRRTPYLIGRRLNRFIRRGVESLSPSPTEVERQIKRSAEVRLLTGSFGSRLDGARLVEVGPTGLRVGNQPDKLKTYPWAGITAAHIVLAVHGDRLIEVELANGEVIRLSGTYDEYLDDMILRLAPRCYDELGDRMRANAPRGTDEPRVNATPKKPQKKKKKIEATSEDAV